MNPWYQSLQKPPLTPPDWVFTPVWLVLYAMITISIILYLRSPEKIFPMAALAILSIHLISNFIWTWLFFSLQNPLAALADILVLDITLFGLLALFYHSSRIAAFLLCPYLAWVLFATYLNFMFFMLNRS